MAISREEKIEVIKEYIIDEYIDEEDEEEIEPILLSFRVE